MTEQVDPRWTPFGAELRRLRLRSGLSQTELGERIPVSKALISGLERGTRRPKSDVAEALDTVLSTGGVLARLHEEISRQGGHWWRDIGLLEQEAITLRDYQMAMVPGLVQTAAYARTSMRNGRPWDRLDIINRDVETRVARLSTLRTDATVWFVVDELVLRRVVGDPAIMEEQLCALLQILREDDRIHMQVIPQHAPRHPGWSGPLRVLEFPDRSPVALAEHLVGEEIIDSARGVSQCAQLFGCLQGEALPPTESVRLITKIMEEYRNEQ
jgi:transcriptional regulator with XRE-family HTH domain